MVKECLFRQVMNPTVHLNNEMVRQANEIHNERMDGMLTETKGKIASTTFAGFRTANMPRELANAEADIGESRGTTQSKNGLPISLTITNTIISVASTTKNTPLVCITSMPSICLASLRNSTMYLTMNRMNSFSKEPLS